MLCRISLGYGVPPSEVESWSASDVDRVTAYFHREPWGPLRDNMHAALIVANIRNIFRGKNSRQVKLEDFMFVDKSEHKKKSLAGFVSWARGLAKPKGDKR